MKALYILILLFISNFFGYSQTKSIEFDYSVKYVVPIKNKVNDTLTINMDKEGKYLWTDYKKLGLDFARAVFKNKTYSDSEINSNIIFSTETGDFYFDFSGGESQMFLKLNLKDFVPVAPGDAINEDISLISSKTANKIEVLGKEYDEYEIYPKNEPEGKLLAVFDDSKAFNSNNLFKTILEILLQSTQSTGTIDYDLPNGIILKLAENGNTIIQAVEVQQKKKIINLNYSLEIKE